MKNAKNMTLFIGVICNLVVVVWTVIRLFVGAFINASGAEEIKLYASDVLFCLPIVLAIIVSVVVLMRNLKNKTQRGFPVVSIIMNAAALLLVLLSVISVLPQYAIYAHLGHINTIILGILKRLLLATGCVLSMIGSGLSLPKR